MGTSEWRVSGTPLRSSDPGGSSAPRGLAEPVPRGDLREDVMVVGIHRRLRAQLGQLRALLLSAVGQMLNGGAVVRAREVLLQSRDQPQKSIHGRIAVGVGVELKSGAPKHLAIGEQHSSGTIQTPSWPSR